MGRFERNKNQGSNAGRGFRYQDAVAAYLAIRVWAGVDAPAIIIPEGKDDVERRTAQGSSFVQVKSRREHLGMMPIASVKNYIKELWDRHDNATITTFNVTLVVECEIAGHVTEFNGHVPILPSLLSKLPGGERGGHLLAKTIIMQMPAPRESSIQLIADSTGCSPLAAEICFAQLLTEVGQLADENGRLSPDDYRGLSSSDTDRVVTGALVAVDADQIERAVRDGACEPVDFLTPLNDPNFFLGVDVQPGHIAARLVLSRAEPRQALTRGLEARRAALIAGPSGAGKSAIMWDTAHALRHTVRWYRLLRLDLRDMSALKQLLRTLRAKPDSPVGIVVDDVGRRGAAVWDALTREFAAIPGALLLGSIREEDLFLIEGRARALEVRAEADPELARRLFDELQGIGRTTWAGWQEPWRLSQGLALEYVHLLSAGRRFEETLADQVNARQRDPARSVELSVLRVVVFASAAGAAVEAAALASVLGITDDEVAHSLKRLIDEHLVIKDKAGRLSGLHQLRSTALLRLTHEVPLPTLEATFARTVNAVAAADLEPLVREAIRTHQIPIPAVISLLSARLKREPDINALSSMLRGLDAVRIAGAVDQWLTLPSVKALPRTQVGTAAMFGVSGVPMPDLEPLIQAAMAAADLAAIKNDTASDPRIALLDSISADIISEMVAHAGDATTLDRFLAAQIGMPLLGKVAATLNRPPKSLLDDPLDAVAGLLGTLAELDRSRAEAWVDEVGESFLVARLTQEVPWSSPPTFEDAEDGRVIRCDYYYIYDPSQVQPHEDVVRICEIALALSPRSDVVASAARAPNGEIAGSSIVALAEKRIPRGNLPTAALPSWNRRWCDTIAAKVATPTYSSYLADAVNMLNRLAPTFERVLDALLRGKRVPRVSLEVLEDVHQSAQTLTPPNVAIARVSGTGSSEINTAVTELQNVLFNTSTDVILRFYKLPDGIGAYIAWLGDLIGQLDKAARDEPWELVGGAPQSLTKLRESLVALKIIVGELDSEPIAPSTRWASVIRTARAGNALRMASTIVAARAERARDKLASDLRMRLAVMGVECDILVRENQDSLLPWPPSDVLALIPLKSFADIGDANQTATIIRNNLPTTIRLTVIPTIKGLTIPNFGLSGYENLLPLPNEALNWIGQLGLPFFHSELSATFDRAITFASSLYSMDRLSLGRTGRAAAEFDARKRLDDEFMRERELLHRIAVPLNKKLAAEANNIIDQIRVGQIGYADALHEYLNGDAPKILEAITGLGLELAQVDLENI